MGHSTRLMLSDRGASDWRPSDEKGQNAVHRLSQEFDWGRLEEPGPQTESSIERGFRLPGPVDDEWGRSESLDPDNVGDIADEGPGHRG